MMMRRTPVLMLFVLLIFAPAALAEGALPAAPSTSVRGGSSPDQEGPDRHRRERRRLREHERSGRRRGSRSRAGARRPLALRRGLVDSSGNANHGMVFGDPQFVPGVLGDTQSRSMGLTTTSRW